MKRFVLIALVAIVALAGGVSAWIFVSLPALCGNEIAKDARSPDGQHRAILFERDCGATTSFSTQVAIVGASEELPNEAGNVMTAKGAPWDGPWAIEWTGADTLTIRFHAREEIHRAETIVEGIAIQYEPSQ